MKKVAFILALAFVFLVGEKIVFEHKIWAGEKDKKKIVIWIPFDQHGKAILDMTKKGDFDFTKEYEGKSGPPIDVKDWKLIHNITNTTVIFHENNPFCYTVWSEGTWVTR